MENTDNAAPEGQNNVAFGPANDGINDHVVSEEEGTTTTAQSAPDDHGVASANEVTVNFVPQYEDLLTETVREDMVVVCGRKRGIWVARKGALSAHFQDEEKATRTLTDAGLAHVVDTLRTTEGKDYDPKKDALVYFSTPINLRCKDDTDQKPTKVVRISRGKNTLSRQRIA